MAMQLIAENLNSQTPSVAQLSHWVNLYNLTFPVLADPNWSVGDPVGNGYIPFYWVLDQNLIIRQKGNNLSSFHSIIQNLLGSKH